MARIKAVKGLPLKVSVGVLNDDTVVDINDGSWVIETELRYQTKTGPIPFAVTSTPSANSVLVELTGTQTSQLEHRGAGYVLIVKATNEVDQVYLKTELMLDVRNGL